jgi:hypothetical protein
VIPQQSAQDNNHGGGCGNWTDRQIDRQTQTDRQTDRECVLRSRASNDNHAALQSAARVGGNGDQVSAALGKSGVILVE